MCILLNIYMIKHQGSSQEKFRLLQIEDGVEVDFAKLTETRKGKEIKIQRLDNPIRQRDDDSERFAE